MEAAQEADMVAAPEKRHQMEADTVAARHQMEADTIAALRAEIEALRAAVAEEQGKRVSAPSYGDSGVGGWPWMYWRRPVREDDPMSGWIVIAPGGATPRGHRNTGVYNHMMATGFEPLEQYGPIAPPSDSVAWPSYVQILKGGGEREFPLSQVLAYKWHLRPPVPGVTFPQYEEVKDRVQRAVCPQCGMEAWDVPDSTRIGYVLFEHLWNTHDFDAEKAEKFCHKQGFVYVRQSIMDETTIIRNRRAAERLVRSAKGGNEGE